MKRVAVLLLAALFGCAAAPDEPEGYQDRLESVTVQLRDRNYRLLLRSDPEEPSFRPLHQQLSALPAELAEPGFASDEPLATLAEVEERAWAARMRFAAAYDQNIQAATPRQPGGNANFLIERLYLDLDAGDAVMLPGLQELFDRQQALQLLVRALRRHEGLPEMPAGLGHFSPLPLPVGLDDRLRQAGFEPRTAYRGFRLLRAIFRAGDPALLHHAVQYPLRVTLPESVVWVENAESLHRIAARIVHSPLRDAVLRTNFSQAMIRQRSIALPGDGLQLVPECSEAHCSREAMLGAVIMPPSSMP